MELVGFLQEIAELMFFQTSDSPQSEKEEVEILNALAHPKTTTKSALPNASEESKEGRTAKNEECEKAAGLAKLIALEAEDQSNLARKAEGLQKAVEKPKSTKKKMKKSSPCPQPWDPPAATDRAVLLTAFHDAAAKGKEAKKGN